MSVRISRRKFLASLGLGALACGTYSHIESTLLDIGRHSIQASKYSGWGPLTILQISDLHASKWVSLEYLRKAIDVGVQLKPNLICMTGDYITGGKYDQFDTYAQILKRLPQAAPTFACLGNNDAQIVPSQPNNTAAVRELLQKSGIELLDNASRELEIRNSRLRVVGVGDIHRGICDPARAFAGLSKSDLPTVLLSHNPDSKMPLKPYPWDLLLCGHTHGGQVCIPFLGPPVLPVRDRRFAAGLYHWDNRWVHVTKGIGNWYGLRFNCRPEVSLLTIT